jgi:hypothetical protein
MLSVLVLLLLQPEKDFCALEVRVTDPAGNAVTVPYEVKSGTNKIVQSGKSEGGTIRACDIGWQGYSLSVGAELCGRTTIDKLELHWGQTTHLRVIYQSCHANQGFNGCRVLLRALNSTGPAASDGSVEIAGDSRTCVPDAYGRCLFTMAYGTEEKFKFISGRTVVSTVGINCDKSRPLIERDVMVP